MAAVLAAETLRRQSWRGIRNRRRHLLENMSTIIMAGVPLGGLSSVYSEAASVAILSSRKTQVATGHRRHLREMPAYGDCRAERPRAQQSA